MKENQSIEEHSSELNPDKEMDRYVFLARMAAKRKEVACPDTDQAWQALKAKKEPNASGNRKAMRWRMWGAALAGAAAMLAGILCYNHFFAPEVSHTESDYLVAMAYDKTPQHITWQNNDQLVNLSGKDSLSFGNTGATPIAAVTTPTETEAQSAQQAPPLQKLSTPRGMDFKVILPDGTQVWLNAESTIEFPAAFSGNERRVTLKGEAYFKVTRNEKAPFIVTTDKMKVRVLGTEFNFKSYTSETSHVSLVEGSVEVLQPGSEQAEKTLKPGQDAWCDEEGSIHVKEIDTYGVVQWVNGFFYFDNLPLVDILRELGRWYNLGVVFRSTSKMHALMHFSASRNEDVGQAIENLNRLRKVRVEIEGTKLVVY